MIGIYSTVDFACKTLLGSPEHPAVTLHFINSILCGDPLITEVTIPNPIVEIEFDDARMTWRHAPFHLLRRT